MNETMENQETKSDFDQAVHHDDHREKDRRKESSEGYLYISTVGWICRRERFRQMDSTRSH